MPYCKSCHRKISKFDNDVCPYCGQSHPIDPSYETMDFTTNMAALGDRYELPTIRKRKVFIALTLFLGFFGIHWFYIYRPKRGIASIIVSLLFTAGVGSALLLSPLPPYVDYLIAFGGVWFAFLIEGILLSLVDSPKDGRGEFLR